MHLRTVIVSGVALMVFPDVALAGGYRPAPVISDRAVAVKDVRFGDDAGKVLAALKTHYTQADCAATGCSASTRKDGSEERIQVYLNKAGKAWMMDHRGTYRVANDQAGCMRTGKQALVDWTAKYGTTPRGEAFATGSSASETLRFEDVGATQNRISYEIRCDQDGVMRVKLEAMSWKEKENVPAVPTVAAPRL